MKTIALLLACHAVVTARPVSESECRQLNDARRAAQAAECYTNLRASAADPELSRRALLGSARNRVWSGDGLGAARDYEEYLRLDPANREVTIEYVRLLRYRGAYERAEALCSRLLRANPGDAEVLALRSEVLFWAGHRAFAALRDAEQSGSGIAQIAAQEALGMNHAAAQQIRALGAEDAASDMGRFLAERLAEQSRGHSDPVYSVYNDSDGIHDAMEGTSAVFPVHRDHALRMNVAEFWSSAPTGAFTDGRNQARVREFSAGASTLVSPGLSLTMAAGGSTVLGAGSGVRPFYQVGLDGSPWDHWSFSAGAAREFLKVTPRAIDRGVFSDRVSARLARWFDSRTSATVEFDRRWWSDGNRSVEAGAAFARNLVYGRGFNLDAGALTAHQAFVRDLLAVSGFFTPDHFSRYDAYADLHGEAGRHLIWEFRGESGAQRNTTASDLLPNWAVTARLTWKFNRVLRLYGSYERKNYSLLEQQGWYQGFFVSLRVQP